MTPERFSYEFVSSEECVGGDYVVRVDSRRDTKQRVPYSHQTDINSVYILKTLERDKDGNKFNRYWDFGNGWEHIDDFLYNGAINIFKRLDGPRYFEIIVNVGRVHDPNPISIETFERSMSLFVPENFQSLDVPGISSEESVTGNAKPVMFNTIEILNELYWVMRHFSESHLEFRGYIDGEEDSHSLEPIDSKRAYMALALSYPLFEGLLVQLIDRVDLLNEEYQGKSGTRFKYHESNMTRLNPKQNIKTLEESRGVIGSYEQKFLIESFYNESGSLGISRNDLSHNIFEATRGFQNINWYEIARRFIISIAFLDQKVVCAYSQLDAADLKVLEKWLSQREKLGYNDLQEHP